MVNKKNLLKLLDSYEVTAVSSSKENEIEVITVKDTQINFLELSIVLQAGVIYMVEFLNNQFYEIHGNELYGVAQSLLSGNYETRSALVGLKRTKYIVVVRKGNVILPEKFNRAPAGVYSSLPRSFTVKRSRSIQQR